MRLTAWASLVILLGLPFFLLLEGCVPAREFKALDQKYKGLQDHVAVLEHTNDTLDNALKEARAERATMLARSIAAQQYSDSLAGELRRLFEANSRLKKDYTDLESLHKSLLSNNQREMGKMLAEIQRNQSELQGREDALKEMERQLYQRRQEQEREAQRQIADQKKLDSLHTHLEALAASIEKKNQAIAELQRALARQDSISQAIRQRVSDAMYGFEGKGLSVYQKNGRVYVSLEEKLLFKPGKYDVDAKGQEAILALSKVLSQHPDIRIEVEGHTDDVPMKGTGAIKDNWDLSVVRATAIVRLLTSAGRVDPHRITASGRGEFYPLDAAKTAVARQKNRRTEIILIPKIDQVLELIK